MSSKWTEPPLSHAQMMSLRYLKGWGPTAVGLFKAQTLRALERNGYIEWADQNHQYVEITAAGRAALTDHGA